ncbi:unnamed protein product [Danaus chrysippus]|uniref:(African queen) hypothetical protein n=1 Tax=Danaus chrysippus TaxID=151541 RepID=A0A8J2QY58_9NEOP|nr:unnamed protein product [Danaus chrysippus]
MTSADLHQSWYLRICEEFDAFCDKVDEKITKEQQQLKACKKRTELENKLAVELKLKSDLNRQLAELEHRGSELDRVCAAFESRLTIADSDQQRLENAKETYQLAKELTGIRLDFSAPPNVAKGYIKNESHRALVPFDMPLDSEALWRLAANTHTPNNQNIPPN